MRMPVVAACLLSAACATTGPEPAPVAQYRCSNAGLAALIGRKADAALGAEAQRVSGARTLRWGPPRSAMTMDFREDRLTIGYDDAMVVTSAKCG